MRSALILPGGPKWPNGPKLKNVGVTRVYYTANDTQVDEAFLAVVRQSFQVGIMRAPNWNPSDSPEQYAARVVKDIGRLSGGKQLAVMLDMEMHSADWVLRALKEFRRLQPGRNVIWTMESMQGGWFTQELVDFLNGYPQCVVSPQFYEGDMDPIAANTAVIDLIQRGIIWSRIHGFYGLRPVDGKLPDWWDGVLYVEDFSQLP